jgi:hypothetical protein
LAAACSPLQSLPSYAPDEASFTRWHLGAGRQVLLRRSVASSARKEEATGGEYRAPIIVRVVLDDWLDYLSLGCICGIYFFVFKLVPEGWGWPLFIFVIVSHFSVLTLQRL